MTTNGWSYADAWEAAARREPDHLAIVHGTVERTWRELDARADALAAALVGAGLGHQAKVAQLQRNGPDYIEVLFACFKASLVPVNTNYRYGPDELRHLWTDCDAEAVVFAADLAEVVDQVRADLPGVRLWLQVGEGPVPAWATGYEAAAGSGATLPDLPWERSGDDLYLLYTGGTTGYPKGVMWRQDDLFRMIEQSQGEETADEPDYEALLDARKGPGATVLPAAPLMHGTACWFTMPILARAGTVVLLTGRSLDPVELLDTVVARRVKGLCIAGEAFARPLLTALDAEPDRWDLSTLRVIFSSGAALSAPSKARLLAHAPRALVVDGIGSSETGAAARSVAEPGAEVPAFSLSERTRVVDEEGRDVEPGSGQRGRIAVGGFLPVGYYKDPERTAETFVVRDGRRLVITGDWAEVAADGTITLLGRGSSCINTGGEKVYPEEVELALLALPGVGDAGVVGVPDERFGQTVVAVVRPAAGAELVEADLIDGVKARLAGYKAPRRVVLAEDFPRGPNGKLDQGALRDLALRPVQRQR
ncbi:MAG TPA: AMP-binding protein [Iamia sp.]|nr:AMP-binding protein [Iamia sp.]